MSYKNVRIKLFLALFFTIFSITESIATELLPPQKVIKRVSDQLQLKMANENFIVNFNKITKYVNQTIFPTVNFNKISQLVLGTLWKQATPTQKIKFQKEFKILLLRTYARAFFEFKEWTIRYLPLKKFSPNVTRITVKTQVLQPNIKPINVDYRMGLFEGKWKIYDIKIEGISLVINYRASFKNEVKRLGDLNSIIAKLVAKNAKTITKQTRPN